MMLALDQKIVIYVMTSILCTVITESHEQEELPVEISPVTISGTIGADDNRQDSHNLL